VLQVVIILNSKFPQLLFLLVMSATDARYQGIILRIVRLMLMNHLTHTKGRVSQKSICGKEILESVLKSS